MKIKYFLIDNDHIITIIWPYSERKTQFFCIKNPLLRQKQRVLKDKPERESLSPNSHLERTAFPAGCQHKLSGGHAMSRKVIDESTCIALTDDEFLVLLSILQEINCNTEQGEDESFRSLIHKMYDINLCKALASIEAWTNQQGGSLCQGKR